MTTNIPWSNNDQVSEQVNTTTKKANTDLLAKRLVRDFLNAKLLGGDKGTEFYNQAKTDHCAGALDEFKAYYQERSEGSDPESAQVIDNLKKEFLYREMIRIGVTFESKRKTLSDILAREFDLPGDVSMLKKQINVFSLETLDIHLKDKYQRRKFIDRVFDWQEVIEHDMAKQWENILGNKELTPEQQASMKRVFTTRTLIDINDLEEVLGLFSTETEKQLIIKFFLPTVTLYDLGPGQAEVLSDQQIRAAIRQSINEQHLGTDFPLDDADIERAIDDIDPRDITITTALFPGEVVDAILKSKNGKNTIRWAIQDVNKDNYEAIQAASNIGLEPDDEGRLLPSFVKKLRKELGIPNAGLFQQGNFIHGKTTLADGSVQSFYFAIDAIEDDPETMSAPDRAKSEVITLKNVFTADDKINKNWQKNAGQTLTYAEIFAIIQQAKTGSWEFGISTPSDIQNSVNNGTLEEKTLRSDIQTLADLTSAIDGVDTLWSQYGLGEGTNIQSGKPWEKDFWVYTIHAIHEGDRTVILSPGDGTEEAVPFEDFFDAFDSKGLTRLPKMESPDDFLAALQAQKIKSGAFDDILYDKDRGFIPRDKRDDKSFPSIVQFVGHKDTISLFGGVDPAKHGWDMGEWTEEEKKDSSGKVTETVGKYKPGAKHFRGSWNALFAHILDSKAVPKITQVPLKALEKSGPEMHDHGGFLSVAKGLLGHPSIHDMCMAVKNIKDLVKHNLEHGSKHETAKFQLALGKRLGFPEGMMRELRSKVNASTRELMEELITELSGLPTGERATEVAHILSNPHSHDYEIQAAALAMLKKSGTLYASKELLPYQGSFKFFERITGQKYDPKSDLVKMLVARADKAGVPPREEFLIQSYFHVYGGKDYWYMFDWGLWGKVRDAWREGTISETELGGKQGEQLDQLDARNGLAKAKGRGGEVAQAIGAMRTVWGKGGGPHGGPAMHLPALYLTLSNIPKTLHTLQTNALYNDFKTDAHPYPALAFLRTEQHAELFQRIVRKLCENSKDPDMIASYAKVEKARNDNDLEKSFDTIEVFWNKYGTTLHEKLTMSQDPEILYRAKTDKDFEDYVNHMKGFTIDLKFNPKEIVENTYMFSHSSWVWNPYDWLLNAKFNHSTGMLLSKSDDPGTEDAWNAYIHAIEGVRDIQVTENPEENKAFQFERYRVYHEAFYRRAPKLPQNEKLAKQSFMHQLNKLQFTTPTSLDEGFTKTPEYEEIVKQDFQRYISGSRTTREVQSSVVTDARTLLNK